MQKAPVKLVLDVTRFSTEEMVAFTDANKKLDMKRLSKLLAAMCVSCPEGWGQPDDPATFAAMTQIQILAVRKALQAATEEASRAALDELELPDGLTFDLNQVLATDVFELQRKFGGEDVKGCIDVLCRIVTACPWGDPALPKTYLKLSYYGAFYPALVAVLRDMNDTEKNARSISRFT